MTVGILLSIVVVSLSIQSVLRKIYSRNDDSSKIGIYGFTLTMVLSALLLFLLFPKSENKLSTDIFGYAVGFAAAYLCALYFHQLAIAEGSLSLTALVVSYSLMIPTFHGIFFLKESLTVIKIIGMLLVLISLYFVGDVKKVERISVKWVIYAALAFFGNGMCTTVQKMYQLKSGGDFKTEFMIIALAVTAVVLIALCFAKEKSIPVPKLKNGGLVAIGVGLFNALVNMLVMMLARYPAAIVFPTIQGGSIILTYFISRYGFREKLSLNQNIGFYIGVLSVILLNL